MGHVSRREARNSTEWILPDSRRYRGRPRRRSRYDRDNRCRDWMKTEEHYKEQWKKIWDTCVHLSLACCAPNKAKWWKCMWKIFIFAASNQLFMFLNNLSIYWAYNKVTAKYLQRGCPKSSNDNKFIIERLNLSVRRSIHLKNDTPWRYFFVWICSTYLTSLRDNNPYYKQSTWSDMWRHCGDTLNTWEIPIPTAFCVYTSDGSYGIP